MQTETKYEITRDFTDFFDEAVGMGLSQEIRTCSDRYDAGDQLAAGGMKRIIVTHDNITGREVAKAVMKDDSDPVKVERFFHEARICASLEHPNIVPVYDIGYDSDEKPFFTMKLIQGQTLKDLINKKETARTDLLVIFLKICDAIAYSHSRGVIHRDLKPDNVQISSFGEVLVCDWGLSRREDSEEEDLDDTLDSPSAPVTVDGMVKGTPGYMSPEQARGEKNTGKASDIYSLGALLYFILAGKPPLSDESLNDAIDKTGKGEVPRLQQIVQDIPAPLCAICHKAMSLKPEERYESPVDLKNDVFKFIHGYATSVENIGMIGLFRLMLARNRRISLIIVTSLMIIISLIAWFIISLELSRSEALSAKKVAETALVKFKEAEETKHKLTKDAAPRILERVHKALFTYDFEKALEICNFAIDLDYTLSQAHSQKGYVLLSLLRFVDALEEFRIAGFKETQKAVKATKELSAHFNENSPQSLEDFIHVVKTYQKYSMKQMIREQVFSPTMNRLTLEERRKFAEAVIRIQNPNIGEISFSGEAVNLDWRKLKDASGLYKTGVTFLNLQSSAPESLLVLKDLPVKNLVWPKSMGTKYKASDLLPYVLKCKTLEEISVPQKAFNKSQMEKLKDKMKVTSYR